MTPEELLIETLESLEHAMGLLVETGYMYTTKYHKDVKDFVGNKYIDISNIASEINRFFKLGYY